MLLFFKKVTMTVVINLISSPGCGKSVFAALIFAELKMKGYTVEYVPEYVKSLVWKGDLQTIHNQYYVSTQQYVLLKAVDGKVDYIVTDGSLFLGLYYNRHWKENVCDVHKTEAKIKGYLSEFNNHYIFLKRGDFKYEQAGRLHTEEESAMIQDELKSLLLSEKVQFNEYISSKTNLEAILNDLYQR
jgi:hypothetical protein